jgi:spore coat polysaccharide biosynthesis predicted glycosyltransferase SpsG
LLRIKLITHASNEYGYGHLSRTKTLQQQFFATGSDAILTTIDSKHDLSKLNSFFIDNPSIIVIDLDSRYWALKLLALKHFLIEGSNFTDSLILVFDSPNFTIRNLINAHLKNVIYLNPYQDAGSSHQLDTLTGLELFPFSEELRKVRSRNIDYSKLSQIAVSCGGSDPHRISLLFLEILSAFNKRVLDVVISIGPLFSEEYIEALVKAAHLNIHQIVFVNPKNHTHEIFQKSSLVLTTGGLTRYELAYCGIPFITINFDPIQDLASEMFAERGASFHLGNFELGLDSLKVQFLEFFTALIGNKFQQKEMSKNGKLIFKSADISVASRMIELHRGR